MCSTKDVSHWCEGCRQGICQTCRDIHNNMWAARNHTVMTIAARSSRNAEFVREGRDVELEERLREHEIEAEDIKDEQRRHARRGEKLSAFQRRLDSLEARAGQEGTIEEARELFRQVVKADFPTPAAAVSACILTWYVFIRCFPECRS